MSHSSLAGFALALCHRLPKRRLTSFCSTNRILGRTSTVCPLWIQSAAPLQLRMLALPRKKQPERTVDVFCSRCNGPLYKYRKNGKGSLVKCWVERIARDYTAQPCVCPGCASIFARPGMVRGRPAYKIIGDRVFTRGRALHGVEGNVTRSCLLLELYCLLLSKIRKLNGIYIHSAIIHGEDSCYA
jgi:hypothetical protein